MHGGDAARLHGAPRLDGARDPAELAEPVRRAAAALEAGRWIVLGGLARALLDAAPEATAAVLDAAAPDHPACLWTSDFRTAVVNERALRFGRLPARALHFPDVDLVRRVLPRWTMETWKDRLGLLADELAARGVTHAVDLDEDAAEGWRLLDDEHGLPLAEVGVVFAAKELRRRIREGERTGAGRGRVRLAGVRFDFDREAWSAARTTEELLLAREAGIRVVASFSDFAGKARAEAALRTAEPWPAEIAPWFAPSPWR